MTHRELPNPPSNRRGWPWTRAAGLSADPAAGPHLPEVSQREAAGIRSNWPKISIVTPSFQQGRYLEQTIRSVLLQGYPNLEYIVMDGGSSDGSIDIIEKYAPWLTEWTSAPDQGQSDAINKGFARCSGTILTWLNSDDFLAPDALFKVAKAFSTNPGAGAVVGIGNKIDGNGKTYYSPLPARVTRESLFGWCEGQNFMQPACYFSRSAWTTCGPLRMDLEYCMDLALWFSMAERYEFVVLKEDLAFINTHAEAKTIKQRPNMFGEIALLMAAQPGGWEHGRRLMFETLRDSIGSGRLQRLKRRLTGKIRWLRGSA